MSVVVVLMDASFGGNKADDAIGTANSCKSVTALSTKPFNSPQFSSTNIMYNHQ